MRISIVTLSYNQGDFLERAIGSVLGQEFEDLEYIVVDPGSTDGSRATIERYRPLLSSVLLDPDTGPAHGLNKGFAKATGDVFGCLNSDDAYRPGTLRDVAELFACRPDVAIIYGHGCLVDATGRRIRSLRSSRFSLWWYAYGAATVVQQATFFRREAFQAVGGFNESNVTCWDGELLVDMAMRGLRFARVNRCWGLFTMHPASISGSSTWLAAYRADTDRIFEKMIGRPRLRRDSILGGAARVLKWCRDPCAVPARVAASLPQRRRAGP